MQLLTSPAGGTPSVIETESDFAKAISELAGGSGPIAIDAERASGFRYSARAYLIQIFRRGRIASNRSHKFEGFCRNFQFK